MRKQVLLLIMFLITLISSCKEATEYRDVVFFTGTETSPLVKFTVDEPSVIAVTVTSTDKVAQDTEVDVAVSDELLDSYNKANSRSYVALPSKNYNLDKTKVIIKAGTNISEGLRLNILSLEGLDASKIYCIPITITGVSTGIPILEASKTIYIVLNRPVYSRVINMEGCAFNVPKFYDDERVSALSALTMEARVRANSWATVNPFISSVMGIEEQYLLRFGDISLNTGDRLQMGPAQIGGKKYFPSGNTIFKTDTWYHIASVFDGSSIALYVNGVLDVKISVDPGTVSLNGGTYDGFWIGKSNTGRVFNGAISEVRIWNKALTATELQDNACIVDPLSPGLLAYWKFNALQEDGDQIWVHDETGNGFDAYANNGSYTWIENVKCPY